MGSEVSPSNCVAFGDMAGEERSINTYIFREELVWRRSMFLLLSWGSLINTYPRCSFRLIRRHSGNANIVFLDNHVESLNLRELTLPIESVHRLRYYDNKAHLENLRY